MNEPSAKLPQLELIKLETDRIKFTLNNVDVSLANSLRRIMIAEVPTMAIDRVHVHTNTSSLHDEFIVHRLGLIPLISESMDQYEFPRNCSCQGSCDYCTVQFRLRVKNTEPGTLDVTSRDLRQISQQGGDVRPVDFEGPILIIKLKTNQELDVTCSAHKGMGKEHSKWSPVATAAYKMIADINLKQDKIRGLSNKEKHEFARSCPVGVYKVNDSGDIEATKANKCMFCEECLRKGEFLITKSLTRFLNAEDNLVRIKSVKDKFVFSVESTGALKPENILKSAFSILISKLEDIKDFIPRLRNN